MDERARTLLKTLVEHYIADGQPVGSRALSKFSGLDLSPATIRNVMADLEEAGFVVDSAADGQIFLERLRAGDTARPSLVLTDLNMPGADGHAVLAAVRERWPGVPVVLLTGQSLSGASRGFDARLPKPIDVARLRATLAGLLPPTPPKSPKPARRAPVRRPGAEALARMGAEITMGPNWMEARAPAAGLVAVDLDCNHIPDAAMTLATTALFAKGTTTLRNIASWRVKETDRLHAMATELRKVGATVTEGTDFIEITPPAPDTWRHAAIDTYDDHRMAMCFSLLALSPVGVTINDPKCVGKTFPTYFEVLQGLLQ